MTDPARPAAPISVLILTYNEEANMPRCLASVAWADDVLVVDSFSTDGTAEIARAHGARVVERAFDSFSSQRNFGTDEGGLRHEWVLHLDADEVVSPELRGELIGIATADVPSGPDAYRVASKTMFQGQWLRRSGMYPAYQVRFGRRSRLRFVQVGHGQREALAPRDVGTLQHALDHYSFSKGLHEWFEKHNRYSTDEARESHARMAAQPGWVGSEWAALTHGDSTERRRALKTLATKLPFRPTARFLYMYVARGGFLDGAAGLAYCQLLATYEAMTVAKEREIKLRDQGMSV